jgi:hypothetical protein
MNCWPIHVKREHIVLLQFVWIEMMPRFYSWFSLEDAWKTWAKFSENPANPKLTKIKQAVNELWLLHIQAN